MLRSHPTARAGFTLTELLIVLAVIAILAAILFPVIASARRRAQDTICVSNLKQMSHAVAMYVSDYDGAYPLSVQGSVINNTIAVETPLWGELLKPYLSNKPVPSCPLGDWPGGLPEDARGLSKFCGYAMNSRLNRTVQRQQGQFAQGGRDEAALRYPALTVILEDTRVGLFLANTPDMARTPQDLQHCCGYVLMNDNYDLVLNQAPGALRHHDGGDYAFADGHVKWMRPTQFRMDRVSDGLTPGFGL